MSKEQLKQILDDLGLTPREAAELLGCSLRTVYNWLEGRHYVSASAARTLQEQMALAVAPEFLAGLAEAGFTAPSIGLEAALA